MATMQQLFDSVRCPEVPRPILWDMAEDLGFTYAARARGESASDLNSEMFWEMVLLDYAQGKDLSFWGCDR